MRISPRIQLPANFDNRFIEPARNTHDLPLLCLLLWEHRTERLRTAPFYYYVKSST